MTTIPTVAVGAVVLNDDNLLLIRRGHGPSGGKWSVPGGHVEPGEQSKLRLFAKLLKKPKHGKFDFKCDKCTCCRTLLETCVRKRVGESCFDHWGQAKACPTLALLEPLPKLKIHTKRAILITQRNQRPLPV